jgi:pimeloyl-ACP methyl ester carboxylesterase
MTAAPDPAPAPRLHHVQCLHPGGLHRLAYWEWGDPANDRVLVCVHGLSRQGRDFDVLARALCDRWRVVCPDVVGRGESDRLPDPMGYGVPQYVADMVTLLARLRARTLDWVGTSMGGLVGLGVAALEGSPVRRLVLNDVGPVIEHAALARIGTYLGLPITWPDEATAAAYLRAISQGFGPHTDEQWMALTRPQLRRTDDGAAWKPHYDPAIAVPFRLVTPEVAAAGQAALWAAYDALRCPTLVVRGSDSDLLSQATAEAMTRRGPRARLHVVPGVGHAPTLVADDQVAAVAAFLSEGDSAGR